MAETRTNETVHYEVLALRGGRWFIERTAPEEALAVKLADQLLHQDIEGVRVSRETVDGATGLSSSRKIYERLKPKRRRQRWTPRQKVAPPAPRPASAPAAPTPLSRDAPASSPAAAPWRQVPRRWPSCCRDYCTADRAGRHRAAEEVIQLAAR